MSNENNVFLSSFLRAIRDACLHQVAFSSRISTSGFLCVSVDGQRQSQFVIDEVFRKAGQEGTSHSFPLKNMDLKTNRSHYSQRPLHRDQRSRPQGTLIPTSGCLRTAGRRRNKPHNPGKAQGYMTSQGRAVSTPRPCLSQTGGRASPRSNIVAEPSMTPGGFTHARNMHKSLHNLSQRSPGPQAQSAWSNLTRNTFSTRSLAPHLRTGTRHFFRSSSRNEKNNTTFTLDNVMRPLDGTEKGNTTQNQGSVCPPVPLSRYSDKSDSLMCPSKNMQNRDTSSVLRTNKVSQTNTNTVNSIELNGKRDNFSGPCKLLGQKCEQKQNCCHGFPSEISHKISLDSVDRSDVRKGIKGSTHTLSNPMHNHLGGSNSCMSCPSVADIDTSCEVELPRMSDLDDTDYLSEQDISIDKTEPPYGFVESQLEPYEYLTNDLNEPNITDKPKHEISSLFQDAVLDISPIISEPVVKSGSKAPPREVYSDGNILDNHQNGGTVKSQEISNHGKSNGSINHSSITIKHAISQEIKSHFNNSDNQCHASYREISEIVDDVMNMMTQSQHKDYGEEQRCSEWAAVNAPRVWKGDAQHPDSEQIAMEDIRAVRQDQTRNSFRSLTHQGDKMVVPLRPMSPQDQHVPLVTSVRPQPREWNCTKGSCSDARFKIRSSAASDLRSSSNNHGSSSHNHGSNHGSSSQNYGSSSQNNGSNHGSSSQNYGSSSQNYGSSSQNNGSTIHNHESTSHNYGCTSHNGSSIHTSKHVHQVTPREAPLITGKIQHSTGVIGVRPSPTFHMVNSQDATTFRGSNNSQAPVKGLRSTMSQRSVVSQLSARGQRSAVSQRSTMSQESAGDWSVDAEVTESPSVIKKKSKLRKWMRLFKKDTSPLPLRDAQHTLPAAASPTADNWARRHSQRCPDYKKRLKDGERGRAQPCQVKGVRL